VAVALGGCSLAPSKTSNTGGYSGAKGLIAAKINLLSSDASSANGSDICKNVLAPNVRSRLNRIGSCATIIDNQLKTADDFTLTIKSITVNASSATARVQNVVKGKKVISTVHLVKQSRRWGISGV
jgi:hypothetical protein